MPDLSGPRPVDRQSHARHVRVRAASRKTVHCQSTFRPALRTAPVFVLAAKARPAYRADRPATSTFSCRWRPTSSSARRRRSALPCAGLDGHRGDGRRVRCSDHRQDENQGEGAGWHPVRPPFPDCGKRHADAALPADRRYVCAGGGGNPQNLTKKQKNCWRSSKNSRPVKLNRVRGFLQNGQGLLRDARQHPVSRRLDRFRLRLYPFMRKFDDLPFNRVDWYCQCPCNPRVR